MTANRADRGARERSRTTTKVLTDRIVRLLREQPQLRRDEAYDRRHKALENRKLESRAPLPVYPLGGAIWYWVCQNCGCYKAYPSRTNLYCGFCARLPKYRYPSSDGRIGTD